MTTTGVSTLKQSLWGSVGFHGIVAVLASLTLPGLQDELLSNDQVIVVEMVDIAAVTNAPAVQPSPESKPEETGAKPVPPPPAPSSEVRKPAPVPEPLPDVVALPPRPEPEPGTTKPIPEPVAKPALPESVVPNVLAQATPVRKPDAPQSADPMASLLKTIEETIEDLKIESPAPEQEPPEVTEKPAAGADFADQIAQALKATSTKSADVTRPISISVIEAVKQQLGKCWIAPIGVENARDLAVEIRVHMNPDATVGTAEILDTGRVQADKTFRAAAERALRATRNPNCQPFPLPLNQYRQWRTMTINFNPEDML